MVKHERASTQDPRCLLQAKELRTEGRRKEIRIMYPCCRPNLRRLFHVSLADKGTTSHVGKEAKRLASQRTISPSDPRARKSRPSRRIRRICIRVPCAQAVRYLSQCATLGRPAQAGPGQASQFRIPCRLPGHRRCWPACCRQSSALRSGVMDGMIRKPGMQASSCSLAHACPCGRPLRSLPGQTAFLLRACPCKEHAGLGCSVRSIPRC